MRTRYIPSTPTPENVTAARLAALRASPGGQALLNRIDRKYSRVGQRRQVAEAALASRIKLTGARGVRCLNPIPEPEQVRLIPALGAGYAAALRAKLER